METIEIIEKTKHGEFRANLDPVHGGLKMAEMGSFIGGGIGSFILTSVLAPQLMGLSLVVGLLGGVGTSFAVNRALKERWLSGRELVANSERVALTKHGKIDAVVDTQQQVNVLAWYFEVKKDHPRARKGWYLLGLALEQDENYVIVYSATSPKEFEKLEYAEKFIKLEREKKDSDSAKSVTGMRRAGEQRRLYDAEILRQMLGGDMDYEDFTAYLDYIKANYPHWA